MVKETFRPAAMTLALKKLCNKYKNMYFNKKWSPAEFEDISGNSEFTMTPYCMTITLLIL